MEDYADTRELRRLMLRARPSDRLEAVALSERGQPDVILMALNFLRFEEWEAPRRIHGRPAASHIPVI